MKKTLIAGLCAVLGLILSVAAETSAETTTGEFRLSIKHDGVRASAGDETLRYSPQWDGGSNETAKVTLKQGDAVLSENLTAERFIAYINRERIDYTKWQQTLFEGQDIESLAADARMTSARIRRQRAERVGRKA